MAAASKARTSSTWACKLKSNGTKRARINGRGYEQIDGIHYDGSSIHAPVTNDASVRIVMTLALMAGWIGRISDVKGAFLKGDLDIDKEEMYLKVPEGFEKYYGQNVLLRLMKAGLVVLGGRLHDMGPERGSS